MENIDQAILFHIPDKCPTSHAPICQAIEEHLAKDKDKENIGVAANMQDLESQALLQPFGQDNLRKRRSGKTPLVETEVRRSDRIKKDNNGYRRKICDTQSCLPCNAIPPVIPNKVVNNPTKSFFKVAEDELQERLSKRPKKKGQEEVDKVPKATVVNVPSNQTESLQPAHAGTGALAPLPALLPPSGMLSSLALLMAAS